MPNVVPLSSCMKSLRIQFSLRFAMLATSVVALMAFWFVARSPDIEFSLDRVQYRTLNLEPYSRDHNYRQATFSVTNSSPYTIWYWGNAQDSRPDCTDLQEYYNTWNQCGRSTNASNWVALRAGKSIDVPIQLHDDSKSVKIGVIFKGAIYGKSIELWSNKCLVPPRTRG